MKRISCRYPMTSLVLLLLLPLAPIETIAQEAKGIFPYDAPVVDRGDRPASLGGLRDHPLVVVAYAASMPDCRKEIGRFIALAGSFHDREVKFLAIDISPLEAKRFPGMIPADAGNVLFFKDIKGRIRQTLKVELIPTTFLVSRNGEIVEGVKASHSWDTDDFRRRVESFLTRGR